MAYTTAQKMLDQFGATELAEVAAPRERERVTAVVLRKHIAGESITDETADVQAAAAAAKARIENAILEAEGIADAYIRSGGYSTPLTTVPEYITGAVEDMARWILHKANPTEAITERNKTARATLDRIASGKMVIVESDGDLPSRTSNADIAVDGPDEVFTDANLNSFMGGL